MLLNQKAAPMSAAEEIIDLRAELAEQRARAEKWEKIAKSGSRCMLSMAAVLAVATMGMVAVVILWLRAAAAAKGGC